MILPSATRGQGCLFTKFTGSSRRINQTPAEVKSEGLAAAGGVNQSCLHDVEEDFLAQAVLAFEELVLGVGAGDVSADQLLAGGRHLQQLRVLVLHWHVSGVAQQLPDNGPEMVRDAFSDQLLDEGQVRRPHFVPFCCCCCCVCECPPSGACPSCVSTPPTR